MTIGIGIDLRNARLLLIQNAIDDGADEYNTGKLRIYSGTRPATGEAIDEYENTLLAEFVLSYPCGSITEGILTFNEIADVLALVSDTAVWGRIVDVSDVFVMDLSVTSLAGSGDIKMDSIEFSAGSTVHCLSGVITEGNI